MYQVLARKWRPLAFEDLVGQRHVAVTLTNAVRAGRVAHAYLFAGVRGTGKTTVARILARCLNCEQGPTPTPCNACTPCREIAESRAIDVLEIDAASRTKVDQTREMLEVVSYAPARDRNRVLIIDEAHMLSKASFNALLKTLEEPPRNVVFVLATTELQRFPATVLSRCQVFEFRRVPPRELLGHLRRVAEGEGFRISDAALERVARAGEGSVRDALSVLERVVAFAGAEIPDEQVLQVLGAVGPEVLVEWTRLLGRRDAGGMLSLLDGVAEAGHDLQHFRSELLAVLRDVMLARSVPDPAAVLTRSAEEAAALDGAARDLSLEDLVRAFQLLADLEAGLRASSQPRFLFEACLIRMASLGHVRPIEELLRALGGSAVAATPAAAAPEKKNVEAPQRAAAAAAPRAVAAERSAAPAPPSAAADLPAALLEALQQAKPMLGAILGQAEAVELGAHELTVRFDRGHETLAQTLERKPNLSALEEHASALAGRALRARIEVGDPVAPASAGAGAAPEDGSRDELLRSAREDPGVKKLLREFGAQVLEIQPLDAVVATEPEAQDGLVEEAR